MPDHNRLNDLFDRARTQLDQIDSVRSQVEERIADLRPTPAGWPPSRLALAALVLAVLGPLLWWRLAPSSPPPSPPAPLEDLFTLQTNGAELTEHLAAFVDGRAVLVLWSYRGPGVSTDPAEHRSGRYRLRTLHRHTAPDGRTFVWSLFIPDPGVRPTFEPPSVSAKLADDTRLAFSASCQRTSAAALRSANLADRSSPTPEDVLRVIDNETR